MLTRPTVTPVKPAKAACTALCAKILQYMRSPEVVGMERIKYEGSIYFTSASLKRFLISDFSQGPTSFRIGLPLRSVCTSPARMSYRGESSMLAADDHDIIRTCLLHLKHCCCVIRKEQKQLNDSFSKREVAATHVTLGNCVIYNPGLRLKSAPRAFLLCTAAADLLVLTVHRICCCSLVASDSAGVLMTSDICIGLSGQVPTGKNARHQQAFLCQY